MRRLQMIKLTGKTWGYRRNSRPTFALEILSNPWSLQSHTFVHTSIRRRRIRNRLICCS